MAAGALLSVLAVQTMFLCAGLSLIVVIMIVAAPAVSGSPDDPALGRRYFVCTEA